MLSVGDISAKRCWTAKTLVGPRSPYTRNWLSSWKEILASYRKEILLSSWKKILQSSGIEILSVTLKVLIMATLKKILPLSWNEILWNFVMKSSWIAEVAFVKLCLFSISVCNKYAWRFVTRHLHTLNKWKVTAIPHICHRHHRHVCVKKYHQRWR